MRWEYYTFMLEAEGWFIGGRLDPDRLRDELNRLGADGWELVSIFDTNAHEGVTREIHVVLKRPMR